jgi:hypothetical protein
LGTANDAGQQQEPASSKMARGGDIPPEPVFDPNLTDEQRENQRTDRLAAVEARLKKQGGQAPKKKKTTNTELKGPNTEPLMRW